MEGSRFSRYVPLRYIFESKAYQQRLGFLTGIILLTKPLRPTRFYDLQRLFLKSIRGKQKYWIPPPIGSDEEFEEKADYINAQRKRVKDPSHSRDIISWARDLRLISEKPENTRTWKGSSLYFLTPKEQKEVFLTNAYLPNPLKLMEEQQLFFLYLLFDADGLFLIPFLRNLINSEELEIPTERDLPETLDPKDARSIFRKTWSDLAEALLESQNYYLRQNGIRLKKRVSRIRKGRRVDIDGPLGVRSYYIKTLSKMEPMVDLGLLERRTKYRAHYSPVKWKLSAFRERENEALRNLIPNKEDGLSKYLNENFFHYVAEAYKKNEKVDEKNHSSILEHCMATVYMDLISSGWPIVKRNVLALLTCIKALLNDPSIIVELSDVLDYQIKLQSRYGLKKVQLYVDYEGKLSSIKIEQTTVQKMLSNS